MSQCSIQGNYKLEILHCIQCSFSFIQGGGRLYSLSILRFYISGNKFLKIIWYFAGLKMS